VKRLLLLVFVCFFVLSCKKENDEPDVFDFSISKIEKIEANVESTKIIRLIVTSNNVSPDNVFLSLEDVPDGITYSFDKIVGVPEYAANLEIKIARNTAGGLHTLKIIGSSSSKIKVFPFQINIDKSLSATFTVYNVTDFDPEDYNSNLIDSALVKLYHDESSFLKGIPNFQEYTRNNGKAYFYRLPVGNYLFTIEKGAASNVVQKRDVEGVSKGFIVAGLFRTKQEIMNSAQLNAKPGDLKFRDLNIDNKIDESDLGQYDSFSIYDGVINEKVIWIGK